MHATAPQAPHQHRLRMSSACQGSRLAVRAAGAAGAAAAAPSGARLAKFASHNTDTSYSVAIMGDLHLEPAQMHLFHEAREQLLAAMAAGADGGACSARVVQLGDLGGYKHRPGSAECFRVASQYLDSYALPSALITGNHDLEGDEFETDEDNLAAWWAAFGQHHHWAVQLGPVLLVGLSTVRFRSNKHSVHEVFIDDEQVAWFERVLADHPDTPVVVFSHAPPIGSGLKVVQNVHVRNRCAWLNHSDRPQRFVRLVEQHPNVKLWFSGHYHLSQNYLDSISTVNSCAFVQTGVIGEGTRDGHRQSRLLRFDARGYEVLTVDHGDGGRLRRDLAHTWDAAAAPAPITPEHEIIVEPGAGWLCSQLDCQVGGGGPGQGVSWLPAGRNCLLAMHDGLLLEYDMAMRAPLGLVAYVDGCSSVSLVDASGGPPAAADGSDAVAVLLVDAETGAMTRLERNEDGGFYRIHQDNKWRAKKAAEAAAAAAAAAAAHLALVSSGAPRT